MIRLDINLYFLENNINLDDIFLNHREGIDPENYRVGELSINEFKNILVLNPETNIIMDYYFDDREDLTWFDISKYYVFNDGYIEPDTYYINRDGILYSEYTKKYKTIVRTEPYPHYDLSYVSSSRKGHSKRVQIHRLIASIFVPNLSPDEKKYVDHIDRNKENYSLNNLRWVNNIENIHNSQKSSYQGRYIYYAYEDKDKTRLAFKLTSEELYNSEYSKSDLKNCVSIYSPYNGKIKGYYWSREDLDLIEYLNGDIIDESLWVESIHDNDIFVHPLGLIKDKYGNITTGSSRKYYGRYKQKVINGKGWMVHILVAECFLNNRKEIPIGLEIDHIDGNSLNNRVENLRICSHSENMMNDVTRSKFSKPVVDKLGREFMSISECAKYYGISRKYLTKLINLGNAGFSYK